MLSLHDEDDLLEAVDYLEVELVEASVEGRIMISIIVQYFIDVRVLRQETQD